ncbi:serine hydrolase domain-containing protein [Streptomyces parvus]|uniref:hypothetical protein n=1 Tax=Streptomyces parvus TaxID=66428 RepID=UPI0037138D88
MGTPSRGGRAEAVRDGILPATLPPLDVSPGQATKYCWSTRSGRLLGDEDTRLALTPQIAEREEKVRGYRWMYGFGLTFLLGDDGEVVRWGHTGEEDGVSARLYHNPAADVDIAILGNVSWSAGDLGWALHEVVLDA